MKLLMKLLSRTHSVQLITSTAALNRITLTITLELGTKLIESIISTTNLILVDYATLSQSLRWLEMLRGLTPCTLYHSIHVHYFAYLIIQ